MMGGINSPAFKMFEDLFVRGFYALQKHVEGLGAIVQVRHSFSGRFLANSLLNSIVIIIGLNIVIMHVIIVSTMIIIITIIITVVIMTIILLLSNKLTNESIFLIEQGVEKY